MSEKSFEDTYESLKDKSNTYVPFDDDLNEHGETNKHGMEYQFLREVDGEMENDYTKLSDDENGSDFETVLPSEVFIETCEFSIKFNSDSYKARRTETTVEDGEHWVLQKTNNHTIDQRLTFIATSEIERINHSLSYMEHKTFHLDFDDSVLQLRYLSLDVRGATSLILSKGQSGCMTKHFQNNLQEYLFTSPPSDQSLSQCFTAIHLLATGTTFELPNANLEVKTTNPGVVNNCPIVPRRYFAKQYIFQVWIALESKQVNGMNTLYLQVLCQHNRVSRVMFHIEISKGNINALLALHEMLTRKNNSVLEFENDRPRGRQLRRDESKRFNCMVVEFVQLTGEQVCLQLLESTFWKVFQNETTGKICYIPFPMKKMLVRMTDSSSASNVINQIFQYPAILQDAFFRSIGIPVIKHRGQLVCLPKTLKIPAFSLNQIRVKIPEKMNVGNTFEMFLQSLNFDEDCIRSKTSDFGECSRENREESYASNLNMAMLQTYTTQKQVFSVEQKTIQMIQTSDISENSINISDFPTQNTLDMAGYITVATQNELLHPTKDERTTFVRISDYSERVKEMQCTKLSVGKEPRFSCPSTLDLPTSISSSRGKADRKTFFQSHFADHASNVVTSSTSREKQENKRKKETGIKDHGIRYCTQAYEYQEDTNINEDAITDGAGVIFVGVADRSIEQSDAADHSERIVSIHSRTMTIVHPSSDQDETWRICPSSAKHTATQYDNKIPYSKHGLIVPSEGATNGKIILYNTCCFDGFLVMIYIVLKFDPVLRRQFETTSNEMHQVFYNIWRHYERGECNRGKILWCVYGDMIPGGSTLINLEGQERERIFSTFSKNRILTEIRCSENDCLSVIMSKEPHGILTIWKTDGKPLVEIIERQINSYLMKTLGECRSIQRNGKECRGSRVRRIKDPPYFLPINLYHLRLLTETYSSEDLPETVQFNEHKYELKLVRLYKDVHFVDKLKVVDDWTYYDNKEGKLCYFDRDPESSLLSSCFYVRKTQQI